MSIRTSTFSHSESFKQIPPTIIVIFGASGDLTARKLAPAIFNLSKDELLPSECFLIGYGRKKISDSQFRDYLKMSLDAHSRRDIRPETWSRLVQNISFHAGEYDDLESFKNLSSKITEIEKTLSKEVQCLFYVSTPPGVFKPILENLGASGLAKRHRRKEIESKVIIEKPFGRDLMSAKELNNIVNHRFEETQVFRIDHYRIKLIK
jgi:glucose-6-phosphate 1-dehydrogenase